ncbi:hypothetical protein, partial [Enterococcus thailandicus]|uniref:hypothetical protein n=1 Tax=Enterococcus thailandicus TaxID=417368 RepID=UPI0022E2639B
TVQKHEKLFLSVAHYFFGAERLAPQPYSRCSPSSFFGNKSSFLKIWKTIFRKVFLLLEA